MEFSLAISDSSANKVNLEIAGNENRRRTALLHGAPQYTVYSSEKLTDSEGFSDVIIGTALDRLDQAVFISACRKRHDRNVGDLAYSPDELCAAVSHQIQAEN